MARDVTIDLESDVPHFENKLTRDIVNTLSELYDSEYFEDQLFIEDKNVDNSENAETFSAWSVMPPYFCSDQENQSNKRKRGDQASHWSDNGVNFIASNIQNAKSYGQCVKSNIQHEYYIWRSCVEPQTYRYILNNGRYRESKAIGHNAAYSRPIRRQVENKVLNTEQKKLQREIQTQLRQEFDMVEKRKYFCHSDSIPNFQTAGKSRSLTPPSWKRIQETSKMVAESQETRRSNISPRQVKLPPIIFPLVTARGSEIPQSFAIDEPIHRSRGCEKSEVVYRSQSEPPHSSFPPRNDLPAHNELEVSSMTCHKDTPTHRHSHYGILYQGSTVNHHDDEFKNVERPQLLTEGSNFDVKCKKHTKSDVDSSSDEEKMSTDDTQSTLNLSRSDSSRQNILASMTQIKYMAASGEVSRIPKFGRNINSSMKLSDFYSSLVKETTIRNKMTGSDREVDVKSTKVELKTVLTTKLVAPTFPKYRSQKLSHLFTDSNSTKLVTSGFKAVPVGQMKLPETKSCQPGAKGLHMLPQISGRKVRIPETTHRII